MSSFHGVDFHPFPPQDMLSAGILLSHLRLQMNWTQEQLSRKSGVSRSLIRILEQGKYPYRLRKRVIEGFSHAFRLNFGVLYDQCLTPHSSQEARTTQEVR